MGTGAGGGAGLWLFPTAVGTTKAERQWAHALNLFRRLLAAWDRLDTRRLPPETVMSHARRAARDLALDGWNLQPNPNPAGTPHAVLTHHNQPAAALTITDRPRLRFPDPTTAATWDGQTLGTPEHVALTGLAWAATNPDPPTPTPRTIRAATRPITPTPGITRTQQQQRRGRGL